MNPRRRWIVAISMISTLASACQLVLGLDEKVGGAPTDGGTRPDTQAVAASEAGASDGSVQDAPQEDATDSSTLLSEDFESYTLGTTWGDTTSHGNWFTNFAGMGSVSITKDLSKVLELVPQAPPPDAGNENTHAALVTTNQSFADFDLVARVRTVEQLREPTANAWEVAWVLWAYTDNNHFYSMILKTNGWELGKEVLTDAGTQTQVFLATGNTPTFDVQQWTEIEVVQVGAKTTIKAGGIEITSFVDNNNPYLSGKIGLYTEDARVHFDDVVVRSAH